MDKLDQAMATQHEQRISRALEAIDRLQARVRELEGAEREPIAVIGIGCRFPGGADNAQLFWQMLLDGRDGIVSVPKDRWDSDALFDSNPDTLGRLNAREGGFVDAPEWFDADFFGIAAKEAVSMDPQQRLLLEVAWQAMEHAGLIPGTLKGKPVGVFAGVSSNDYSHLLLNRGQESIDAYLATGNSHSVAAGRLSYSFGFTGPSMVIDTACSSSLVAVHLACQSLRSGECDLAMAAGVNRILSADGSIAFSRAQMLAADGRCKSFAAAADGFVRSEGCGMVVLKRLSDALRDADRVLCVIRGTAVNQDGRSSGLTVPNGPAQQAVLGQALRSSGIKPAQMDYIETHGTGTALGDPIEAGALGAVFGGRERSLYIGSVKTNVGHLEAAAGICGLIKTALALSHSRIPAQLHFQQPNPHIDWAQLPLQVVDAQMPWPQDGERYAGVSSFGFSGTNAHIVLQGPPEKHSAPEPLDAGEDVLLLSAKGPQALRETVQAYSTFLADTEAGWRTICWNALATRSQFRWRLALPAASKRQALQQLDANLCQLPQSPQPAETSQAPRVVFLFTGQGSQLPNMGKELYLSEAAFRQAIDRCDRWLQTQQGWSLTALLYAGENDERLGQTRYAQPALFSLGYALTELWRAWGIRPAAVLGHSIGEYTAAVCAGVFKIETALELVCERGRLMQELPAEGGMAAVHMAAEALTPLLPGELVIAADNAAEVCVVSGPTQAIATLATQLEALNQPLRALPVSHAFHSPSMRPMVAAFGALAQRVRYHSPDIPFYSTVTGALSGPATITADYWAQQIEAPVRFRQAVQALVSDGFVCCVEIGPQPHLTALLSERGSNDKIECFPSLNRERQDRSSMAAAVAALYLRGCRLQRPDQAPRTELPNYPWQRQYYWFDPADTAPRPAKLPANLHPLLGAAIKLPASADTRFAARLDLRQETWLNQHSVFEHTVLPAAGLVEMAAAAAEVGSSLAQVDFLTALTLTASEPVTVHTVLSENDAGRRFDIFSMQPDGAWTHHAGGGLSGSRQIERPAENLADAQRICRTAVAVEACYRRLQQQRIEYGPAFRALREIRVAPGHVLCHLELPAEIATESYLLHPILLDACVQSIVALYVDKEELPTLLPAGIELFQVFCLTSPKSCWCSLQAREADHGVTADLSLFASNGECIARLSGLRLRRANAEQIGVKAASDECLYQTTWQELPQPALSEAAVPVPEFASVQRSFDTQWALPDCRTYVETLPALNRLAQLYMRRVRADMQAQSADGKDVVAGKQALWRRINEWSQTVPLQSWRELEDIRLVLLNRCPQAEAELTLLQRSASQLAGILRGQSDAGDVLFPGGDGRVLTRLYETSPGARLTNVAASDVVQRILSTLPQAAQILEIGSGTGGTTAHMLPLLSENVASYLVTDLSPELLNFARQRFGESDSRLQYRQLDIETNPQQQGFQLASCDLVIAANVLHATADLRLSLRHAAALLKPGGYLLLLEVTQTQAWLDLVFGVTDGWWKFTGADGRSGHPLLHLERWRHLLQQSGFSSLKTIAAGDDSPHAVMVARRNPAERSALALFAAASDPLAAALAGRMPHCQHYEYDTDLPAVTSVGQNLPEFIVYLADSESDDPAAQTSQANALLAMLQSLAATGATPRVLIVTRGASAADGSVQRPELAVLWGLARVARLEYPEFACRRIDLDVYDACDVQVQQLIQELNADTAEHSTAWRLGRRLSMRLQRPGLASVSQSSALVINKRGSPDDLTWQPLERRKPLAHEVEIRVQAAGLNMIDVLDVLDVLPFERDWLGVECAGEVVAVGEQVSDIAVGDVVIGLAPGTFRHYVTVTSQWVVRRPQCLSAIESATVPAAFLTAYIALVETAGLVADERILIHAASGATGMAATALARSLQAEIFATASRGKWNRLRDQGIALLMDSRTTEFSDQVIAAGGVDVVLNSLSGEFIPAGLRCLKPGGRFVEIGKRGIWSAEEVRRLRPDVRYSCVDVMELARLYPEHIKDGLQTVCAGFDSGQLTPLPHRSFAAEHAAEAFHTLQRAAHIGKLVLTFETLSPPFVASGAYLVTGGWGGLGMSTAKWLAERGAGQIILVSRRLPGEAAKADMQRELGYSTELITYSVDVADEAAMSQLFERIVAECKPLKGIFHAAGVLADTLLKNLNAEGLRTVLRPKAVGAWYLHRLSRRCPLDYFVLYSSAASLFGSPGQGAHVAANSYLDALAAYRQGLGLPGLAINWGPWSDVGSASAAATQTLMRQRGIGSLKEADGRQWLATLSRQRRLSQVGVVPVDWVEFMRVTGAASDPLFSAFRVSRVTTGSEDSARSQWQRVRQLSPKQQKLTLVRLLQSEAAAVLGCAPDRSPDSKTGFFDMGMDSLMAVELRNRLTRVSGITLSSSAIFEYPTIDALSGHLLALLMQPSDSAEPPATAEPAATAVDAVVTDTEIAAELAELTRLLDGDRG